MENKYILTPNGELYHWGVKGQKWGVRRYQNGDGTLTEAGRRRYARDAKEQNWKIGDDGIARGKHKKGAGEVHDPDPNRWVKEDMERTKKVAEETERTVNKIKTANEKAMRDKPQTRADLSKMSDKELRDKINREFLERQYNDMFTPQKSNKGRKYAGKILETAGTVIGITGGALGIAVAIKELRG